MTAATTTLNPGVGGDKPLVDTLSTVDGGAAPASAIAQMVKVGFGTASDFKTASDSTPLPFKLSGLLYPVSTANSSGVQLAAAASFTGTIESVQNVQALQVSVVCDQAYTVQVKQFLDAGGARALPTVTFTRLANVPTNENIALFGDYAQIIVTNNGGSATTTFQCGVTFGLMPTLPASLTNSGNLRTAVQEIMPALLASYNVAGVIAINTVLLTIDCLGARSVSIQCVSMGTTGAVTPEWSNDNSTWLAATILTQAGATATTFSAAGLWVVPVQARYLRLRLSTATTAGTTTLSCYSFDDRAQMWLATQPVSGTVSVTGYPTAAASADALANPTVTKVDSTGLLFNGTTWDRARGMSGNLTTGDTGAKTATGNGATLTNVGNKGVQVLVSMGAVTGTTPTAVLKLQGSVDGGTSWYDIPGATTASLTATGLYGITVYPGIAVTAGTTTTGTTASANFVMPRTWRVVWTIGGTTPSFTITAIQYNYLNN
jgi:hypothetical protein